MAQAPLVLKVLASSVSVASKAGQIIKDVMGSGQLGIVKKGGGKNDLQTEADRSAQKCIVASLTKLFPEITVIGEEGPLDNPHEVPNNWIITDMDPEVLSRNCPEKWVNVQPENIVVWVDPLDGTSEYTEGLLDHVTVLIGVSVNGEPVAGVVHQPYFNYKIDKDPQGRTIWGLVGLGVGGFVPADPPTDKFIITTTRSHSSPLVVETLEALKPDEIIRVGGAGHKVLLLLEGKAHAYVFASAGCKKWDTCAPEAVLRTVGGKLTDIHGKVYNYGKDVSYPNAQGVFGTTKNIDHDSLIAKIPQALKDKFPY